MHLADATEGQSASRLHSHRGRIDQWIFGRIVYRAVVLLRGEGAVFRYFDQLQRRQWDHPEVIAERQARRLTLLLQHAYARCPYYAARPFPTHLSLDTARRILMDLPLLSKADVQREFEQMMAVPRLRRVTRKVTGGSTGEAVTIVKNRSALAAEMAASWLGYSWFGVRMGDRAVRFWGAPAKLRRKLRFAAADFTMHRIRFSAFAFDEDDLEKYWRRCLRFRPDYFYGYVSMLEAFAHFVERRRYDGPSLRLKAIVATSEVLTETHRSLFKRVFDCPVQNEYGCGEVGPIAYSCNKGTLHAMAENLIVEVLRPDGSEAGIGETGEVVVTDLNNFAMPLIRYRVGDLAVRADACSCGRGYPSLERVWGRAYDFVQDASGRRYHGEFFMYFFEELRAAGAGIEQFRVTQVGEADLEVAIVGHEIRLSSDHIARQLQARIPQMAIRMLCVETIPRQRSGKMQVIENRWLRQYPNSVDQDPRSAR